MDSTVVEGADRNPYGPYVADIAGLGKNYEPTNYHGHGRYNWIQISEENQKRIEDQLITLQDSLLLTMGRLSNTLNISQIQERVYLKLKRHEDEFNICHVQARTPSAAEICASQLMKRLQVDMPRAISDILSEY